MAALDRIEKPADGSEKPKGDSEKPVDESAKPKDDSEKPVVVAVVATEAKSTAKSASDKPVVETPSVETVKNDVTQECPNKKRADAKKAAKLAEDTKANQEITEIEESKTKKCIKKVFTVLKAPFKKAWEISENGFKCTKRNIKRLFRAIKRNLTTKTEEPSTKTEE